MRGAVIDQLSQDRALRQVAAHDRHRAAVALVGEEFDRAVTAAGQIADPENPIRDHIERLCAPLPAHRHWPMVWSRRLTGRLRRQFAQDLVEDLVEKCRVISLMENFKDSY